MNWWLTIPLVVALVQSGLSCIILLQNLTEQEGYENIDDDYNLGKWLVDYVFRIAYRLRLGFKKY